jgi:hypothetical protein
LKRKVFVGVGSGAIELKKAWFEVFGRDINDEEIEYWLEKPKGKLLLIGENVKGQQIYWVAVGRSKSICIQAWSDFWPLLDDCIVNWEIIESDRED